MAVKLVKQSDELELNFIERAENLLDARPASGKLERFSGNPVLLPIAENKWESKYVLNAAAIRLEGRVYMLYRAFGQDEVSRIGLAVSDDGYHFDERLADPIFEPSHETECRGCEDPRLTRLGNYLYMTYTAYDGTIAQIALASISVEDFIDYRWEGWRRHGLFRPGLINKDAAVFPEQFDGKFGMLHRIEPNIWITFSETLDFPWPDHEDCILAKPGEGAAWDAKKIGAGSQPIKTEYGWLLITHGVDMDNVYRLGVMLLDLADPSVLIYRSPDPVLEPVCEFELGADDSCWVPNVVFTCGAVPVVEEKEILGADDELIVYYGGADTVMNIATARISDLIPLQFR